MREGSSGTTPRHMHPADENALVTEGAITLAMEGGAPWSFQTGQTFHSHLNTPDVVRKRLGDGDGAVDRDQHHGGGG